MEGEKFAEGQAGIGALPINISLYACLIALHAFNGNGFNMRLTMLNVRLRINYSTHPTSEQKERSRS